MAQIVYYFWGYLQLGEKKVSYIVPSGNFGNIFSAHVAQKMGLPIEQLHVVTNQNDILNRIISSGKMALNSIKETYSPSMDIQISSNFERQIFESIDRDDEKVKKIMNDFKNDKKYFFDKKIQTEFQKIYNSETVTDDTTLETIQKYKEKYNYLADPHTATGLSILDKVSSNHSYISLGCAHPAKFGKAIEEAIGEKPNFPKELENIFDKKEKMTILSNSSKEVKKLILDNV